MMATKLQLTLGLRHKRCIGRGAAIVCHHLYVAYGGLLVKPLSCFVTNRNSFSLTLYFPARNLCYLEELSSMVQDPNRR